MIILLQKDNLKERTTITQYTGNLGFGLNHFPAKYEFMVNYLVANSVSLGLGKKIQFQGVSFVSYRFKIMFPII